VVIGAQVVMGARNLRPQVMGAHRFCAHILGAQVVMGAQVVIGAQVVMGAHDF
jgi:hypothetical protein